MRGELRDLLSDINSRMDAIERKQTGSNSTD
jgi:hypothetical protein